MDATQLLDQASEQTNKVTDAARNVVGRTRKSVQDAGAAADLYLHEYAWTTVAVVAIAACALGFLMGRRD